MLELSPQVAVLVVDAARTAVTRYAPEELEVFDAVAADWRAGTGRPARTSGAPGSAVGFGIDTSLVGELFLQAVAAATSEVLVLGATGIGTGILAGWRRRRRPSEPSPGTEPSSTPPAGDRDGTSADPRPAACASAAPLPGTPAQQDRLELTAEQAVLLRAACRRHALALGLPPEAADLLADATIGATVTPDDR
ncbi:hypothetical protein AB0C22_04610 [Micromonospora sp. NPDC048894]|uniref:hypothetical protein n=1 Tax=unclassified Micromonospora TaxID=2617518 RepID=UPI0033FFB448